MADLAYNFKLNKNHIFGGILLFIVMNSKTSKDHERHFLSVNTSIHVSWACHASGYTTAKIRQI